MSFTLNHAKIFAGAEAMPTVPTSPSAHGPQINIQSLEFQLVLEWSLKSVRWYHVACVTVAEGILIFTGIYRDHSKIKNHPAVSRPKRQPEAHCHHHLDHPNARHMFVHSLPRKNHAKVTTSNEIHNPRLSQSNKSNATFDWKHQAPSILVSTVSTQWTSRPQWVPVLRTGPRSPIFKDANGGLGWDGVILRDHVGLLLYDPKPDIIEKILEVYIHHSDPTWESSLIDPPSYVKL